MNPHSPFQWSQRGDEIKTNLKLIHTHAHTKELARLFEKRVCDLLSDMGLVSKVTSIFTSVSDKISDNERMDELWVIVNDIAKRILQLPRVDATDIQNKRKQWKTFSKHVKLFQGGLDKLGSIPRRQPAKPDQGARKSAGDCDREKLQEEFSLQDAAWRAQQQHEEITLVDMGIESDKDNEPRKGIPKKKKHHHLPLGQDWSTCEKIRKYMVTEGIARAPDLWCRFDESHTLTPQRLSWTRAKLKDPVHGPFIDFVNVDEELKTYIVVLRHHENDRTDVPRAVAIPISGTKCPCPCDETVARHFQQLWPEWIVDERFIYDIRIDAEVKDPTFDTSVYDLLENQLCIFVQNKATAQQVGGNKKRRRKRKQKMDSTEISCNMITE